VDEEEYIDRWGYRVVDATGRVAGFPLRGGYDLRDFAYRDAFVLDG
jgi:hypothetical protein